MSVGPSAQRSPLGAALLAYLLAITFVITLAPFRFALPGGLPPAPPATPFDLAANVFLFLPLGFLYRAVHAAPVLSVAGRGVLVSLAIETAQIFSPGRFFSMLDLASNGAGAGLGALVHVAVQDRLRPRLAGRLALELPLMNLVYLLTPLLWLDGLAVGRRPDRLLLAPILGLFGGRVLVAVWRHRLRPAGVLTPATLGLTAAGWFLVASLPRFLGRPAFLITVSAGLGVVVWRLALLEGPPCPDRRFEGPELRRAAPIFAVHLALLALWPWTLRPDRWRMSLGLLDLRDDPGVLPVARLVELVAAFTLFGYLVAEYRSRREEALGPAATAAAVAALACAAPLELLAGFRPHQGASLLRLVMLVLAGGGGGAIYHSQRESLRAWLGRQGDRGSGAAATPALPPGRTQPT